MFDFVDFVNFAVDLWNKIGLFKFQCPYYFFFILRVGCKINGPFKTKLVNVLEELWGGQVFLYVKIFRLRCFCFDVVLL